MWQGGDSMAVGLYRAMALNNKPNRSSLQVDSKDHRVRSNHKQKLVLGPGLEFDMWTELWGSAPNSSKKKNCILLPQNDLQVANNTDVWGWRPEVVIAIVHDSHTAGPMPSSFLPPTSTLLFPFRSPLILSPYPCGTSTLRMPVCGPLCPHPFHSFPFSAYTSAAMPTISPRVRISQQTEHAAAVHTTVSQEAQSTG